MKVFFEYSSQNPNFDDEYWIVLRDENQEEAFEDFHSPVHKTEAMICIKMYPSDNAIITLRPASRSRKLEEVVHNLKDHYFIIISNREEDLSLMSSKSYEWEKALEVIKYFKSQSFKNAEKIFKIKKL